MAIAPSSSISPMRTAAAASISAARVPAAATPSTKALAAVPVPTDSFVGAVEPNHRVIRVGSSANLKLALSRAKPGDVIRILPGTYQINAGLRVTPGTAAHRIQVLANDPAHPPLIQGALSLNGASNWTLGHLRMQGTVPSQPVLTMGGGHNWKVTDSEFFGARVTKAFANVSIANDKLTKAPPTGYQFVRNKLHGAANFHPDLADHNLYVNAWGGDLRSPGLIARNIMFDAPNGENIKIGYGGMRAKGAWGVKVEYNTLFNANRQILVHSGVKGVVIRRNILWGSHGAKSGVGVYLHELFFPKSVIVADNYAAALAGPLIFAPKPTHPIHFSSARNVLGANPRLKVVGSRFVPQNRAAQTYGANAP